MAVKYKSNWTRVHTETYVTDLDVSAVHTNRSVISGNYIQIHL